MKFIPLAALIALVAPDAVPNPFPAAPIPAIAAGAVRSSQYVAMRDGVRLAIEVTRPQGAPPAARMPVVLRYTRYGRAPQEAGVVLSDARFWATHGYVVVSVDQRGTGSSFGTLRYGKGNLDDIRTVLDWIVAQPWSNGRVVATGTSYEGTTAELVAASGHPAVRAVAPLFSDYDYLDLFEPGGMFAQGLALGFSAATAEMDAGGVAAPVDGDTGNALLHAAVAEHRANPDLAAGLRATEYSDQRVPGFDVLPADFGIPGVRDALRRNKVPELVVASWYDAATVFGTLQRYNELQIPQRVVIIATNHGGHTTADPYGAPVEYTSGSPAAQNRLAFSFFAPFVNGDAPPPSGRSITYFTVGENAWKSTEVWPPAGFESTRLYLGEGGALAPEVQFRAIATLALVPATTGPHSRWYSQLTGEDVALGDVAQAVGAAPAYTSAPLPTSIEITGEPQLRINMFASIADPSVVAFLLAVAPDGATYDLTQGELRLIHRKLAPSRITLHTYARSDVLPVVPGTALDVPIALIPLSATVPKGYRLRVALAAGEHPILTDAGAYTAAVSGTSYLELPVRARPDLDATH